MEINLKLNWGREKKQAPINKVQPPPDYVNQLYKSIFQFIDGTWIDEDTNNQTTIETLQNNTTAFGILTKVTQRTSEIPVCVYELKNGKYTKVEGLPLNDIITHATNEYQSWNEFVRLWQMFYLTTGNGIIYAPRFEAGNMKGQLMDGLRMMPTQYTAIKAKAKDNWRNIIDKYTFTVSGLTTEVDPYNVIHARYPNMNYDNGQNFMGVSPAAIAINIMKAQNNGMAFTQKNFKRGMPPGLLTKIDSMALGDNSELEQEALELAWDQKARTDKPLLATGKHEWIPMGFSNMRDMMILEVLQNGVEQLCMVWGLDPKSFGLDKGAKYDNYKQSEIAMIKGRCLPDIRLLCNKMSPIVKSYGQNLVLLPEEEMIGELTDERLSKSTAMVSLVQAGIYTRNEARTELGLEAIEGLDDVEDSDESLMAKRMNEYKSLNIKD